MTNNGLNLNKLVKQAQEMQDKVIKMRKELEDKMFTGNAGAGTVKVAINGKLEMISLHINPDFDFSDIESLEDLIIAAFNDAKTKYDDEAGGVISDAMGGMKLPGDMKFPL